ncbi:hypothetical protein BaRGS_00034835, partial [Batillaria attramentaria]
LAPSPGRHYEDYGGDGGYEVTMLSSSAIQAEWIRKSFDSVSAHIPSGRRRPANALFLFDRGDGDGDDD